MKSALNLILLVITTLLLTNSSFAEQKTFTTKETREIHAKGLKRDPAKHAAFKKSLAKRAIKTSTVPGKWDLTPKVSGPENQGSCGSCWDFSITKALRSELMLVGKDPGKLAFNYLLNNCGPGTSESGCGGGDFPAGDNMLKGAGPWLESQDPYRQQESSCKQGLSVAGSALTWNLVGSGNNPPTFEELAEANFNAGAGHMLSVDVAAGSGSWESYSSGIYNQDGGHSIDHMIDLVGYNCESSVDEHGDCAFVNGQPVNHDGYLIVENNWGTSWGENGYMRTRWGMNAIAETAMYFEVQAPPPPPTPTPTPIPPVPPTPPEPPVPPSPDFKIPLWAAGVMGGLGLLVVILLWLLIKPKNP